MSLRAEIAEIVLRTFTTTMSTRGPVITRDQALHVERLVDALLPLLTREIERLEQIAEAAEQWRAQRFDIDAPGAKERAFILRLGEAEEHLARVLGKFTEPPKYNPEFRARREEAGG